MDGKTGFRVGDKTPRTLIDEYADEQARSEQADAFSIIGASVRGKLHRHNDIPRDDAFFARFDGTWLVVAVADGAGSRPNSRYGASYLVNKLCNRMLTGVTRRAKVNQQEPIPQNIDLLSSPLSVTQLPQNNGVAHGELTNTPRIILSNIVSEAFRHTRVDLERFASKNVVAIDEFHSTLLGFLMNTKTGDLGVGQIGDGLILGLDNNKDARLLVEPPTTGDPGASYFVTQEDWERYFDSRDYSKEVAKEFSTFYLMTDGVANDCQYGPPPDILRIWANDMDREIRLVPSLQITTERLKNYLTNYKAKGSFDDRTLVVVYRNNETG